MQLLASGQKLKSKWKQYMESVATRALMTGLDLALGARSDWKLFKRSEFVQISVFDFPSVKLQVIIGPVWSRGFI